MLIEISAWWLRQIIALVPARLRRPARARDALIVAVDHFGDDAPVRGAILIRRDGRETFAAPLQNGAARPVEANRMPMALRLPPGAVLRREVTLPLAAAHDLYHALGFEMDRLTPFQPEEVLWGVGDVSRDPARGLRVTLFFALRAPVERLLAALGRLNLKPEFLEAEDGQIALDGGAAAPARQWRLALSGLCAVLAVACAVAPVLRQQMEISDVQARIAPLQAASAQAEALRRKLAAALSGSSAIAAAAKAGDALQMIAALTNALPDGTFLTDLTLKSGDLTIDGQSSDAARLIGMLAAAPGFHNVTFTAPVTRTINGQADLFSIHATVAP